MIQFCVLALVVFASILILARAVVLARRSRKLSDDADRLRAAIIESLASHLRQVRK